MSSGNDPRVRGRLREQVMKNAGFRCEYCLTPLEYSIQPFVTEHILPTSKGGKSILVNLACACGGCNGHKSNKTEAIDPTDQKLATIFNPRVDIWAAHFTWSGDFLKIIGITPTGRATVETLKINLAGAVNVRSLLLLAGKHPPISG